MFSDLPIPPGEVLQEEIAAREMTQRELSARLGKPPQAVNEIIRAKKAITPDTAIRLGNVLGIAPQFWINLEADYRTALAMNREREMLEANVTWLDSYPIREMLKRGWIDADRDKLSRLKALMSFLGVAVAEPRAYYEAVGFRITEAAERRVSQGALAVWLRKGELDAQAMSIADYDENAFKTALASIREMTGRSPKEFLSAMTDLCSEAGVAFCMVRELPKSGANGATRWLSNRKALIQMSIRNKWADIFWFTFFHEACHLLKHRKKRRIVIDGLGVDPTLAQMEAEADRFAADFLIAPGDWSSFCQEGQFTADAVKKFAQSASVAPFIVVGRLQKENWIGYSQLASLKRRYKWVNDEG